jgi:hypothetical protein
LDLSCIVDSSKDTEGRVNRHGVVHAVVDVERADLLHLLLRERELGDLEILRETRGVIALGNNGKSLLECPAEEDLGFGCNSKNIELTCEGSKTSTKKDALFPLS